MLKNEFLYYKKEWENKNLSSDAYILFLHIYLDSISSGVTPTDTNIAKYYGVSRQCLLNYKNGAIKKQRLYIAMKLYFMSQNP